MDLARQELHLEVVERPVDRGELYPRRSRSTTGRGPRRNQKRSGVDEVHFLPRLRPRMSCFLRATASAISAKLVPSR